MSDANPFETPRPNGTTRIQGTLRVVVAAYCLGAAASVLHLNQPDPLAAFWVSSRGLPAEQVLPLSRLIGYGLALTGALTALRPVNLLGMAIVIYAAAASFTGLLTPGESVSRLTPALECTRWMAPLALLLADFWPPRIKPTLTLMLSAVSLLRLAASVTFLATGIACLVACVDGGSLVEHAQAATQNILQQEIDDGAARKVLAFAGGISLGMGGMLMFSSNAAVPFLASLWGALLAFTPILAAGRSHYAESLLRISEWGAPMVVALFHLSCVRTAPTTYLPESGTAGGK